MAVIISTESEQTSGKPIGACHLVTKTVGGEYLHPVVFRADRFYLWVCNGTVNSNGEISLAEGIIPLSHDSVQSLLAPLTADYSVLETTMFKSAPCLLNASRCTTESDDDVVLLHLETMQLEPITVKIPVAMYPYFQEILTSWQTNLPFPVGTYATEQDQLDRLVTGPTETNSFQEQLFKQRGQ